MDIRFQVMNVYMITNFEDFEHGKRLGGTLMLDKLIREIDKKGKSSVDRDYLMFKLSTRTKSASKAMSLDAKRTTN